MRSYVCALTALVEAARADGAWVDAGAYRVDSSSSTSLSSNTNNNNNNDNDDGVDSSIGQPHSHSQILSQTSATSVSITWVRMQKMCSSVADNLWAAIPLLDLRQAKLLVPLIWLCVRIRTTYHVDYACVQQGLCCMFGIWLLLYTAVVMFHI